MKSPESPVQIGVNPLIWSNDDDPELGGDIPLERCLREARRAGFSGIEMGGKFPRSQEKLNALLTEYDLSLISGWYSARLLVRGAEGELSAVRDHLNLLRAMQCEVMIFSDVTRAVHQEPVALSSRPTLSSSQWNRFTTQLTQVAQAFAERDIRLAYHHHMGTFIQTPDEIERLLTTTPDEVELLLDTGHFAYAGGTAEELSRLIARWGSRIAHVHLKDVRSDVLRWALDHDTPFLDAVVAGIFTVPGDGELEMARTIRELKNAGYEGWLVVEAEQDPKRAQPLRYATLGYENTSAMMGSWLPPAAE